MATNRLEPQESDQRCSGCGVKMTFSTAVGLCPRCSLESALLAQDRFGAQDDYAGATTPPPSEAAMRPTIHERYSLPRILGDYELLEEIARGGMGIVFRAQQRSLNRPVAIKMLLHGPHCRSDFIHRFQVEAEAVASLHHPNIVAIHEVGLHEGERFLAMDYVAGPNLAELLKGQPMQPKRAARYLERISDAIQHAHQRGVLHRDIKPSNVLVDSDDQPRVTDFGLAKRFTTTESGDLDANLTQSGQVLGSPNYLSPEQAIGDRDRIGCGSDVYAMGAMLYHMLVGRPPFAANSIAETLQLVREQDPIALRLLNPSVPRDLETICLKCLQKDPGRRYRTARELSDELSRFLRNEPIRARPVGYWERSLRWSRRNKMAAGLLLGMCVSLLLTLRLLLEVGRERDHSAQVSRQHATRLKQAIENKRESLQNMWANSAARFIPVTSEDIAMLEERTKPSLRPDMEATRWTMGITAEEDPIGRVQQHAKLLEELELGGEKLLKNPLRIDLVIYKYSEDFVSDLVAGEKVQLGRIGALRYLRSQHLGANLKRLVVPVVTRKTGVLFTRLGNEIQSWRGCRGKRIAFGDTNATISFWAQIKLIDHGITSVDLMGYEYLDSTLEFVEMVRSIGIEKARQTFGPLHSHAEVIRGVLSGDFDIGVANRSVLMPHLREGLAVVPGTEFESSPTMFVAGPQFNPQHAEVFVSLMTGFKESWVESLPEQSTGFRAAADSDFAEEERRFNEVFHSFPIKTTSAKPPPHRAHK